MPDQILKKNLVLDKIHLDIKSSPQCLCNSTFPGPGVTEFTSKSEQYTKYLQCNKRSPRGDHTYVRQKSNYSFVLHEVDAKNFNNFSGLKSKQENENLTTNVHAHIGIICLLN